MAVFVDPKTGERFDSVPDADAERARSQFGLVPEAEFAKEQRAGGAVNQVKTFGETALGTTAELGSQLSRFAGDVDAMGNPISTVEPVPASSLAPAAFTPEALERREVNPVAAQLGALAPEAATLLIPGVGELGWAARLGMAGARAAVGGSIAEAGQAVITGEEFDPAKAAFYGVVGESLGALASGALGRMMRTTGKAAPEALEVAARKATKADVGDALGELTSSPLKAQKLADNAVELTRKASDELGEAFTSIESRMSKAEAAMFSKANVGRAVSKNIEAQQDVILTQGAKLDQLAADLTRDGQGAYGKLVRENVDELLNARTSPQMYLAARKAAKTLAAEAPEDLPQAAREVIGQLDDMLADETTWGSVAKSYAEHRASAQGRQAFAADLFDGVGVNRPKVTGLFEPGADRAALTSYLDAAEAAARQSGDKSLRKSVDAARAALAGGDDVLGAKVVTQTFGKTVADFAADRLVGKGLKYALGAVGLGHGPVGAVAGAAAGEYLAPKIAGAIRAPIEKALEGVTVDGTRAVLQNLTRSATTQIQTAGRALTNGAVRSAQATIRTIGQPTMSVGIARFMGDHDSVRGAYAEKRAILEKLQSNPQLLVDEMAENLGSLSETAPQLHSALVAKTFQAVSFIRSKMPATIGASLSSPSGVPPSQLAVRQFALYYTAATDPSSVVEDVKNNRVRAEQMEALRTVWPEVYADLKSSVLDGLNSSKPSPQQRMRMDLLFDFGKSLDAGLSWSLAVKAGEARQAAAKATPRGRSGGGSARSVAGLQPGGLQALANPQGMV